jgi:two-component system sensor histidine kinase MprB
VVSGNAERLRVAIRNLLDNAAKFGPAEGPVELSLADGELTVRDHGPGIAPEDLERVFDRFYRVTADRSVPGSGLGLAIVRQIAHAHSGTITADSPPSGSGAVLRFSLPASEEFGFSGPVIPEDPNSSRRWSVDRAVRTS